MSISPMNQNAIPTPALSKHRYWEEAFQRNIGFLTPGEQERLLHTTVAIPGLGGVGGNHLATLARLGIGGFHLADLDRFEPVNVNRQFGAQIGNFGRPKAEVLAETARAINPYVRLKVYTEGVQEENLDAFLEGVSVVVDGMDFFNFDTRRAIFLRAWQKGIHVVTAGPMGFGSALLVFAPDRGMDFDRYFDIRDKMSMEQKLIAFMVGLAPKAAHKRYLLPGSVSMSAQRGPSLGAGCQMCGAVAAAEVVRIALNKPGLRPAPCYFQYDPFVRKFHRGRLWFGNRGPLQRLKRHLLKTGLAEANGFIAEPRPSIPRETGLGRMGLSAGVRTYLLDAARRAPSGDNCQPWRFAVQGRTVQVFLDPAADRSFFNVAQSASLISCGAAAENVRIAATGLGLKTDMRTTAGANWARVDVDLMPGAVSEDPLHRFLWERHTNRTPYDGTPLDGDDLAQLQGAVAEFENVRLVTLADPKDLLETARVVFAVDRIRARHRGLHRHLMQMIRFSPEEARDKRDGFALRNLEAGPLGEGLLRCLRPWPVAAFLNRLGFDRLISAVSYLGVRSASAVGMLKVAGTTPDCLIAGGRALERVWLTATRMGLAFQPMTAVTLFWLRWQQQGAQAFEEAHRNLLSRIWPRFRRLFEVQDPGESLIMLFRMGRGRPVQCRTLRKPLEWLMMPEMDANQATRRDRGLENGAAAERKAG